MLHPQLGCTRTPLLTIIPTRRHTRALKQPEPQSYLFYILPSASTPIHQYSLCTLCARSTPISTQSTAIQTSPPFQTYLGHAKKYLLQHLGKLWPSLIVDDLLDATKYSSSLPAHLKWRIKLRPALRVVLHLHIQEAIRLSTNMQTKRDARFLFGARSRGTSVPCTPFVRFWSTIKSV